MILNGNNYNLRSDISENRRLRGGSLYNESRAEHFLNIYNKPVIATGGNISKPQIEEIILRVSAYQPRRRVKNENIKQLVSGRSTQGINRDLKNTRRQGYEIMKKNTKRQMLYNQQPIV